MLVWIVPCRIYSKKENLQQSDAEGACPERPVNAVRWFLRFAQRGHVVFEPLVRFAETLPLRHPRLGEIDAVLVDIDIDRDAVHEIAVRDRVFDDRSMGHFRERRFLQLI